MSRSQVRETSTTYIVSTTNAPTLATSAIVSTDCAKLPRAGVCGNPNANSSAKPKHRYASEVSVTRVQRRRQCSRPR